ncbi:hypothetical protein ABK040_007201 [Willaertia magna]
MSEDEIVIVYHIPKEDNFKCLIYDAKTVQILRDKYRIIAIPFGSLANFAQQNNFSSVPCILSPESVTLGIEKGFIKIYQDHSSNQIIHSINHFVIDSKSFQLPMTVNNQQQMLNKEEIDITTQWKYPNTNEIEVNRYLVYKDLYEHGYFLTKGDKFGCDFLCYKGDPLIYHADYMVYVQSFEKEMSPLEMISVGRLSNTVHKTILFASYANGKVHYLTLEWFNTQPIKPWMLKSLIEDSRRKRK